MIELERINTLAVHLAGGRCPLPKGVFRFKTHEQANAWQEAVQAQLMAELARARADG